MQNDDVIWSVINTQFCSYKVKTTTQNFCRNVYNVTGFCSRQSCPLANSRYATVREHEAQGVLYLYVKTIERAHSPKHMWEKIKLSSNYTKALEQIDNELIYWPNFTVHKCKQRVTKITQYLIRMRKLKLRNDPKLIGVKKKLERREATRERKALSAAHLERSIEKELIERLKSKAYGDAPLNVNEEVWAAVLRKEKGEIDGVDLEDEESEEEEEVEVEREFVSDDSGLEDEDGFDGLSDLEEMEEAEDDEDEGSEGLEGSEEEDESGSEQEEDQKSPKMMSNKKRKGPAAKPARKDNRVKKRPRVEVEYEYETEPIKSKVSTTASW